MAEKGIYCLILKTGGAVLDVGALGEVTFPAGYYVYVGSALGPGGLARVQRHIRVYRKTTEHRPRWHIDRLLIDRRFVFTAAVCGETTERQECMLANRIGGDTIRGFGCSDCRCSSHLFCRDSDPQQECGDALTACGCRPQVTVVTPDPDRNLVRP
ncbi:GIY-YIG nuclease family protein [Methanogenium cariaci]|jgi:Uri superfamily endonuclease